MTSVPFQLVYLFFEGKFPQSVFFLKIIFGKLCFAKILLISRRFVFTVKFIQEGYSLSFHSQCTHHLEHRGRLTQRVGRSICVCQWGRESVFVPGVSREVWGRGETGHLPRIGASSAHVWKKKKIGLDLVHSPNPLKKHTVGGLTCPHWRLPAIPSPNAAIALAQWVTTRRLLCSLEHVCCCLLRTEEKAQQLTDVST